MENRSNFLIRLTSDPSAIIIIGERAPGAYIIALRQGPATVERILADDAISTEPKIFDDLDRCIRFVVGKLKRPTLSIELLPDINATVSE